MKTEIRELTQFEKRAYGKNFKLITPFGVSGWFNNYSEALEAKKTFDKQSHKEPINRGDN